MNTSANAANTIAELIGDGDGLVRVDLQGMAEFRELARRREDTRLAALLADSALYSRLYTDCLTSREVADLLGIPVRLVRELASHGPTPVTRVHGHLLAFGLPAIRYGNKLRFPRKAIEQILGRPVRLVR